MNRVATFAPVILTALLSACREPTTGANATVFVPTGARLLSEGSPTKDEDPSVMRAQDGTLWVAWFSDRGSNPDIYITSTSNGNDWSSPVRVTTSPDGDFNPSLFQDAQGTFHLTWFRWSGSTRY